MQKSNGKKQKRREGKHIAAYDGLKKMAFFSRHGLQLSSYLSLFAHVREYEVGNCGITLAFSIQVKACCLFFLSLAFSS